MPHTPIYDAMPQNDRLKRWRIIETSAGGVGKPITATNIRSEETANLFASAPQLLATVKALAWFIENVNDDTPDRTDRFFDCREMWRNAIRKAEPEKLNTRAIITNPATRGNL